MLNSRGRIIALAASLNLPAVYPERIYVADGRLLSYSIVDHLEPFQQAASYIDRILRGERPADLPVQGPTRYVTVVNVKTAQALGVTGARWAAGGRRRGDRIARSISTFGTSPTS